MSAAAIDWNEARRILRERLRGTIGSGSHDELEDLVQEACVRLHRALERGDVREPEGLMTTIARRTWTDHLRSRGRRRHYVEVYAREATHTSPLADDDLGDLVERLEFVVCAIFDQDDAVECGELARSYFEGHDWQEVAERREIGYAALRKRWSRCLDRLRRVLAEDPDLGPLLP